MLKKIRVNVNNVEKLRQQPPESFEAVLLDPNNDCNLHCVYCHNHRSKNVIATEDLQLFLEENVISVNHFQVGCGMEPTLDPRLGDLMLMIARSRARPKNALRLQTNGTMLKLHDPGKFTEAGLNLLAVSIDSADAELHKALRGGTSLAKVTSNIKWFCAACPNVRTVFLTTVTTENVDHMADLVNFGINIGVSRFVFREMFYRPDSKIVDHSKMPALVLPEGAFSRMRESLSARFGQHAAFVFLDSPTLAEMSQRTLSDSLLRIHPSNPGLAPGK